MPWAVAGKKRTELGYPESSSVPLGPTRPSENSTDLRRTVYGYKTAGHEDNVK